jgi:hypothetical protein
VVAGDRWWGYGEVAMREHSLRRRRLSCPLSARATEAAGSSHLTVCGEILAMNRYGRQAMRHWREVDPDRYAAVPDPEAFFTDLGEEVMQQIETRARALEGTDRPGESYLEKVGRLQMARFMAESEVLRELVLIPAPEDADEVQAPVDGTMGEWYRMRRQLRQEEQDELDAETTRDYSIEE